MFSIEIGFFSGFKNVSAIEHIRIHSLKREKSFKQFNEAITIFRMDILLAKVMQQRLHIHGMCIGVLCFSYGPNILMDSHGALTLEESLKFPDIDFQWIIADSFYIHNPSRNIRVSCLMEQ